MKSFTNSKLLIEGFVYLLIGTSLILFLNSIPNSIVFKDFTKDIWDGLYEGIRLLFESLILLAKASSVLLLIILSFLLIIGGTIRIAKYLTNFSRNSKKRRYKRLYSKRN